MMGSIFSHTSVLPTAMRSRVRFLDIFSTYGVSGLVAAIRRAIISKSRPIRQRFISLAEHSDPQTNRVIWVPTEMVEYETTCLTREQVDTFGAVYSGPWDKPVSSIRSLPYFKSFEEHFSRGVDWGETYFYRDQLRRLRAGTARVASKGELEERLSYLDELYKRIQEQGYKTQRELIKERPTETRSLNNDAPEPELNEIGVCIGRHGRIIKHGAGTHRLYIAKLLEVDCIPVIVRARHTEWQAIRDKTRTTEPIKNFDSDVRGYYDHPDVLS